MRFAKIIDLPNDEQVVVIKAWDEENGFIIDTQTEIDGMAVTTSVGFGDKEETRDHMFDTYNEGAALKFHNEMRKLLIEDE